jgi:predicted deacetylase
VRARLFVSLSGVTDDTLPASSSFAAEMAARGVPLSLLVRPRSLTPGGIRPGSAVVRWLNERRAAGDAIVLHGNDHGLVPTGSWRVGRRAEFAALPRHEAGLRLIAATSALARLGLSSDVFAPPRWLASAGTVAALRQHGFRVCADAVGVRLLADGALLRGRVLAVGADDAAAVWRCQVMVAAAGRAARRGGLARLTVRAGELERASARQAVLDAVDAALRAGASPSTYRLHRARDRHAA